MRKIITAIAIILIITTATTASAAAPASTTSSASSASKSISAGEQLLAAIQEDASKFPGEYYLSGSLLDKIREYVIETPESSEAFDWMRYCMDGRYWELTPECYLHLSGDRHFSLLREDASLTQLDFSLPGFNNNADWNGGYGNDYMPSYDKTFVSNENGFSIWELGKETKYILSDFVPKFITGSNTFVFMHDDSDLRVLDMKKDEVIEICKDYSGVEYEIFYNTLYYINTNGHISMVNLLTWETKEVSSRLAKGFIPLEKYERICSIQGLDFYGKEFPLPGYIDLEGEFQAW